MGVTTQRWTFGETVQIHFFVSLLLSAVLYELIKLLINFYYNIITQVRFVHVVVHNES